MAWELRQAVDWVANGKTAVCQPCQDSTVVKTKNQGLPIADFSISHFKEGINREIVEPHPRWQVTDCGDHPRRSRRWPNA